MTILADTMVGCAVLLKCHWPVNDNFEAAFLKCHWPVNDNFGRHHGGMCSLTKIVIDWSMTVLKQLSKNVMERSITIFASIRNGLSQKIVIDWSMTIFWQPWSNWEWLKAENHSTLWTYHLWPYVIDHSQWQKLMDKAQKSVIDHGQWQKNCHWLKVIYIGVLIAFGELVYEIPYPPDQIYTQRLGAEYEDKFISISTG